MKPRWSSLLDFLKYNRRDRLGLMVLVLATALVWLWPLIKQPPPPLTYTFVPRDISEAEPPAVVPFRVDTVGEAFLFNSGLSQSLAARWVNYRNKGGELHDPEDVLRIYGMDTTWWLRWKDALLFPEANQRRPWKEPADNRVYRGGVLSAAQPDSVSLWQLGVSPRQIVVWKKSVGQPPRLDSATFADWGFLDESLKRELISVLRFDPVFTVDINGGDPAQWAELPGVGKALAERIVGYGEQLGGYRERSQLLEVFGMDSIRYQRLATRVVMGGAKVVTLKVNEAPEAMLAKHPYIGKAGARRLVRFRETVKLFEKASEVQRVLLIPDAEMRKLAPYLEIP
jgi:DNA uptake protein ComE-like DNA-binding protein